MNMTIEEIREARRRKILENSESRLNKILNRSSEPEGKSEDTKITKPMKTSYCVNNDSGLPRCSPTSSDEDFLGLKEDTLEPSPNTFQEGKTSNSFNYLRKYFVVLAVLVYFIVARGGSKFPSKSIFTPFATLAIVKQSLVFRHAEPTSSLFLQLLILYGVNARPHLMKYHTLTTPMTALFAVDVAALFSSSIKILVNFPVLAMEKEWL